MNTVTEKTLALLLLKLFEKRDDYLMNLNNLKKLMYNTTQETLVSILKSLEDDELIALEKTETVYYKLTEKGDAEVEKLCSEFFFSDVSPLII